MYIIICVNRYQPFQLKHGNGEKHSSHLRREICRHATKDGKDLRVLIRPELTNGRCQQQQHLPKRKKVSVTLLLAPHTTHNTPQSHNTAQSQPRICLAYKSFFYDCHQRTNDDDDDDYSCCSSMNGSNHQPANERRDATQSNCW